MYLVTSMETWKYIPAWIREISFVILYVTLASTYICLSYRNLLRVC